MGVLQIPEARPFGGFFTDEQGLISSGKEHGNENLNQICISAPEHRAADVLVSAIRACGGAGSSDCHPRTA